MGRLLLQILLPSLALLLSGCVPDGGSGETGDVPVAVSVAPQAWFVERLAPEGVSVRIMVPSGANPEEYDPAPRDIARLEESRLFLCTGTLPFEEMRVKGLSGTGTRVVRIAERLPQELLHPGEEVGHSHAHGDPHFWSSFEGGRVLARVTCEELVKLLPEDSLTLKQNCDSLIREIDDMEEESRRLLRKESGAGAFLIYHPSLTAFSREMGLRQLAVEQDGKEPSPGALAGLLSEAKEAGARVMLVQKEFNPENSRVIAREAGAKTVEINPYDYDWAAQMRLIVEALAE